MSLSFDYSFKLLIAGDTNVGKSTFVSKYVGLDYENLNETIGVDYLKTDVCLDYNNVVVKLHLFDISGADKYRSIAVSYYRTIQACFILFDLTNKQTFLNCDKWLNDISSICPIKFLIGCKSDLKGERQVTRRQALRYARSKGFMHYFEINRTQDVSVYRNIFELACMQLIESYLNFIKSQEIDIKTSNGVLSVFPLYALLTSDIVYYNCKYELMNINHMFLYNKMKRINGNTLQTQNQIVSFILSIFQF